MPMPIKYIYLALLRTGVVTKTQQNKRRGVPFHQNICKLLVATCIRWSELCCRQTGEGGACAVPRPSLVTV